MHILVLFATFVIIGMSTFYPPTASEITFSGRRYLQDDKISYDWPCFRIAFCFKEATRVVWGVKDTWNIYHIILDGNQTTQIKPEKNTNVTIFQSNNPESHCLEIIKITENHYGPLASHVDSVFSGIEITGGTLQKKIQNFNYRFDFLGDSLTTAFGVLSGTNPVCFLKMKKIQNCLQSWATHISKMFNADYRIMAVSGKGAYHNSLGVPGPKMQSLYTRTTDNSKPYSYKYQDGIIPDVIFILLGANDYSHPVKPNTDKFVRAYRDMLHTALREIMIVSPESRPLLINVCGADMLKTQQMAVQRAVKQFKYEYENTFYVEIPKGPLRNLGCIGHPNVEGQRQIAQTLYPQVKAILNGNQMHQQ